MNTIQPISIKLPSEELSDSDNTYTLNSSSINTLSLKKNHRKSRRCHYNVTTNDLRAELIRRVTEEKQSIRAVICVDFIFCYRLLNNSKLNTQQRRLS